MISKISHMGDESSANRTMWILHSRGEARVIGKREQWFANLTLIWGWVGAGVYYKSLKI